MNRRFLFGDLGKTILSTFCSIAGLRFAWGIEVDSVGVRLGLTFEKKWEVSTSP